MTSTTMRPNRKYGLAWLFSKNPKPKQSGPDQKAKIKDPETIDLDTDQRISQTFITMEATKIR